MEYILDTGFFVISRSYYPDTFSSFWEKMDAAIIANQISSVSEVKAELERYGGEQTYLIDWLNKQRSIFTRPTPEEQNNVREILAKKEFQSLIKKQSILGGYPAADPFVIAKAMTRGGAVVSKESPANRDRNGRIIHIPKIPDVCKNFSIPCFSPQEFMERMEWRF